MKELHLPIFKMKTNRCYDKIKFFTKTHLLNSIISYQKLSKHQYVVEDFDLITTTRTTSLVVFVFTERLVVGINELKFVCI